MITRQELEEKIREIVTGQLRINGGILPDITELAIELTLDAAVKNCEEVLSYDEYDPAIAYVESINKLRVDQG